MKNEIVEKSGKWLVREAVSMDEAVNAINFALVRGSVGGTHTLERNGEKTILADVVRLNDDGTECQPYQHK
jgi:alpha-D-ribose 1-methylphosphonate 5-triphosphate synthase subunit PhnG